MGQGIVLKGKTGEGAQDRKVQGNEPGFGGCALRLVVIFPKEGRNEGDDEGDSDLEGGQWKGFDFFQGLGAEYEGSCHESSRSQGEYFSHSKVSKASSGTEQVKAQDGS